MTDPQDARLAAALRALGERLEVPPAPDVREAVLARLPARPRRRPVVVPRWAGIAAALLLVFAAAVTFSPAVRATVTDLLRFAGIELRSEPGPPVRGQGLLPGERSVELAEARRLTAFPIGVPAALGPPDDVRVTGAPTRVVSLLYQGGTVRIDEFDGQLGPVFEKFLGMSGGRRVSVAGAPAIWIDRPHELMYVDRTGQWRTETARLSAQSLLWQRGAVTYRLEGAFAVEEALRIAATVS